MKRIAGMIPAGGSEGLLSKLTAFRADLCPPQVLANTINAAFLVPMQGFTHLVSPPSAEVSGCIEPADVLQVSQSDVLGALLKPNPNKAPGPDCVSSWLLGEYVDLLARPVTSVLNCSFSEQRLPQTWKSEDVVPIAEEQKVEDIRKHLPLISLTSTISKLAEDFVVSSQFGPAVQVIDSDQFGANPKSSTTQALTSMLHQWLEAMDGTGAAVRVVLFNYRQSFDLIDHGILIQKILSLSIPRRVAQSVINFLTSPKQGVKLSSSCYSGWELVSAGVLQGTKLCPWLFLLMLHDLRMPGVLTWKY